MTFDERVDVVVKAAEEFYLNKNHELNLTDLEYDELLDSVKKDDPNFDIFDVIKGCTGLTVDHKIWFPAATKTKVNDPSWFVPKMTVEMATYLGIPKGTHPVSFNYLRGTLTQVMLYTDLPLGQVKLEGVNSVMPPKIKLDTNVRILGYVDITEDNRLANPVLHGVMVETETQQTSWLDARIALTKTEHFAVIELKEINNPLNEKLSELVFDHKSDQWWNNVFIDLRDKFSGKMDGCSVVVYYKNNKLDYIASRSNDITGKLKTMYLWRFFPDELPVGNAALMCEAVIDLAYGLGWNSRQNANGLINSKYKISEVSKLLSFVVYDAISLDTDQRLNLDDLRKHIYENNMCEIVRGKINAFRSVGITSETPYPEFKANILRGHIVATHGFSKTTNDYEGYIVALDSRDMSEYMRIQNEIISEFKKKDVDDINSELSPEDQIKGFFTGILGGYRYAAVSYDDHETYFFDLRDLSKPKVTTVDYFRFSEFTKFISRNCQAHYRHSDGGTYLIDGLAKHVTRKDVKRSKAKGNDESTEYPFHDIYKWTFNEVADTEVEAIEWQESNFGTLIPIIRFKTVLVEGSWLSKAASGGLARLLQLQCGPGSKIRIVRVNSTIPMVLQVINPAKVNLPCCSHCGRQLTFDEDVYQTLGGALILKCGDSACEGKIHWKKWLLDPSKEFDLEKNLLETLAILIPIENYKPRAKVDQEVYDLLVSTIKSGDFNAFEEVLRAKVYTNMNRDKLNTYQYHVAGAYKVIRQKVGLE